MAGRVGSVVVLSGGVGGARFADGLYRVLPAGTLTVIVNTGDDFRHWGLSISPDLDTVMYTLAGLSDDERGWGLQGETFHALAAMRRVSGPDWFALGDKDLATHLHRTAALAAGRSLTEITRELSTALGVSAALLPMSDLPCPTYVETATHGKLPFQEWFVKHRAPAVRGIDLRGTRAPTPEVLEAIERADLVLIGPSNPYVSIDPILACSGIREALSARPVIAVSPILGGKAVKGPLAEMIPALTGARASVSAIARHYGGLLRGLVVEHGDAPELHETPGSVDPSRRNARVLSTSTLMLTREDRARLAREVLAFGETLV